MILRSELCVAHTVAERRAMPEPSSRYLEMTPAELRLLADLMQCLGHDALAAAEAYRKRADEIEPT